MPRRPAARPRWAYDGTSGQIVEPPEGKRALGFSSQEEPPAQWVNYLLHFNGANIDWLAGPDLSVWTRKAFAGSLPATFTAITGMAFDDETDDTAALRFRYALVGSDVSGPVMLVSKRGATWEARTNFGASTPPGTLRGVRFAAGKWFCWFLGDSTDPSTLLSTAPNDGSTSAIGSDGTLWDAVYTTGASGRLYDLADDRAATAITTKLVAVSGISGGRAYPVVSTNGGTSWTLNTTTELSFGGAGNPHAIVYDGTTWVTITEAGWVWIATDPTGAWTHTATLPSESSWTWRMETDGAGTVVAYQRERSTTVDIRVSTDHGATWTSITAPSSMVYIERIRFADGIWIAASSSAPYLWQSNDPTADNNWTRIPLLSDDGNAWAAYDVILADGAWLAAGFTYTIRSGAARDILAPVYGYDPAPGYLSDAGYLRGRRVDDTAPTDGQVLTWDAGASRWAPADASGGGSTSPTTTLGDMIVRGASVDERLAVGTNGYVLRVVAGAPAWAAAPWVTATGTILTGRVLAWDGSAWVATALSPSYVGAPPTSLTITAGTGLTGGGDLSTDRTLAVSFGTSSTTACVGNDARLSDARAPAATSVSLSTLAAPVAAALKTTVTLPFAAFNASAPYPGADVIGLLYFLPSRFAVSGLTTTLSIEAVGYVVSGTMTLDVLDVTAGFTGAASALSAAITWTETSPTRKTATITLPGSAKIYAATLAMSGAVQGNCGSLVALVDRS